MKNITKKIATLALGGIMLAGIGMGTTEASPRHFNDHQQAQFQEQHHQDQSDEHRRKKVHEENQRHEREMQRHDHEDDDSYHARMERENERHNQSLEQLGAFVAGFILGEAL